MLPIDGEPRLRFLPVGQQYLIHLRYSLSSSPSPSLSWTLLASQLRNIIEFDGGVTDSYLHRAKPSLDTWNVVWPDGTPRYRSPPGYVP